MDARTLAWTVILVILGLAALGVLLAVYRKDRAVTTWSVGVAGSAVGFGVLMTLGIGSPWVLVLLGNSLVVSFAATLPWGLRIFLGHPRPWPWRFSAYALLWTAATLAALVVWPSYPVRGVLFSLTILVFTVEFLALTRTPTTQISRHLRVAVQFLGSAFVLFHAYRIGLVWTLQPVASNADAGLTTYTFLGSVVFGSLWIALLIVLDAERLQTWTQARTEELQRLNALKDRVLAMTSHDLRGPLGNLQVLWGELSLRMEQGRCDEVDRELLSIVDRSLVGTQSLLENLFSFAESQQLSHQDVAETDLLTAARAVAEQWGPSANAKGVVFSLEGPSAVVRAAFPSVVTVLRNLVGNAVKFTPSGGSVVLRIVGGTAPSAEVIDTGIGMPPQLLAKNFRLEERSSRPGTSGERGSGFGLVLVSELVSSWGGTLEFRSEPGQGTLARVGFPS